MPIANRKQGSPVDPEVLKQAVHEERRFALEFFSRLAEKSGDPDGGITRDTYGEGENWGHHVLSEAGADSGLELSTDAAGNTYARWPAPDPTAKTLFMGSHLDSVPRGGNFDGAAGVAAGLVSVRVLRKLGMRPRYSLTVMGVRAEESIWFEVSYIGARSALGTLPGSTLADASRIDTGRSLAQHMSECGARPSLIGSGHQAIVPRDVVAFLEVHIEQAPSLVESEKAVGICSGIPGNFRFPNATITGRHDHVGTPRRFRRDAMMAAVAFATSMDEIWSARDAAGTPMAVTFGRFHTDADLHGLTVVPGLFHFSLDVRAYDEDVLSSVEREMHCAIAAIEDRYRVHFDLGRRASAPVGIISPEIAAGLAVSAKRQNVSHMPLGSPASHDAAAFAAAGIPAAMLFVRNENGSHNPQEAMDIDDFLDACAVIVDWLALNCLA